MWNIIKTETNRDGEKEDISDSFNNYFLSVADKTYFKH
jgi:hypothetical protein